MSAGKPRFGGLGAVFFLGTLGAIAYYVQQQSIPEEREALRKPVTVVAEAAEDEAPPPLPWQDRLDLSALQLVPFGESAPAAPGANPAQGTTPDPASGRLVQDLSDGHRLMYTIDPVLQDAALTIFRNREVPYGAAVVLDLRDNSVLTMAGHSTMDPQVDPLEVLATAWAPAASTFKLVTTASLLENQFATPNTRVCFHGGLHGLTDDLLRDDPSRDDRCETLSTAVAHSLNVIIGKLAKSHLTEDHLSRTARALKFEEEIPFEFPVEASPAHFPADANERAKVAAGFWNVDLSPMHAAVLASIFARGGEYQPPHVLQRIIAPDGSDLTPEAPKRERVLARNVADQVGKMMVRTTVEGTARGSFRDGQGAPYIPGIEVAGKTGSLTGKRPPNLNYNWFIGYAPADDPEIAFAVVLANEPKWKIKAHYAARRLVQIYLTRRDAITEQRDARLSPTGLHLPKRDPETGAIIAQAKPEPAKQEEAPPSPDAPKLPSVAEDALPPVPGPLPKKPSTDAATEPKSETAPDKTGAG
jgi:membrane peptidoglycan carboxypeptidase